MKSKIVILFLVFAVLISGCTQQEPAKDDTVQGDSMTDAGLAADIGNVESLDAELQDTDLENLDSDLDSVIGALE